MGDTRQRQFDTILSINMVYRYDTIRYHMILLPSPKQTKISINHCTMPKHNKFLFKKRILSTFLGLILLLLAAITSPALENNFSDGTDVPHVPGTPKYRRLWLFSACAYKLRLQETMRLTDNVRLTSGIIVATPSMRKHVIATRVIDRS